MAVMERMPGPEEFTISGNLVDVVSRRVYPATVHIVSGVIREIVPGPSGDGGVYITPGLVDSHVHVESSMLPPAEFARVALTHGTLAVVCDPHEVANVMGVGGVEYMIGQARRSPLRFAVGAPSCVPATPFETSGADIGPDDVEGLLSMDGVTHLAEVMNYPAVIAREETVMSKIHAAQRRGKPVDGHAPGLSGDDLAAYVGAGITTDHEVTTAREALEKISKGMKVIIREGSAAQNFNDLHGLIERHGSMCMMCTDDIHPDDLARGHMDTLVRRAVRLGHDPVEVVRCASLVPVMHYGLPMGLVRQGDPADLLVVDDISEFRVAHTYAAGRLVARYGKPLLEHEDAPCPNTFRARPIRKSDIEVPAAGGNMAVMEASSGSLYTTMTHEAPLVTGGLVASDVSRDILKIVVVNRYRAQRPQVAFVRGFGLTSGALASSVAHDSHNIVAVGVHDEDICAAVNLVVERGGGLALAGGGVADCLELPIAGLMSPLDGWEVAARYARLRDGARSMGSPMADPFITLSFMCLLVIPELKLGDKGLFDVTAFSFTSLWSGR